VPERLADLYFFNVIADALYENFMRLIRDTVRNNGSVKRRREFGGQI
jgi:hypothetical protein